MLFLEKQECSRTSDILLRVVKKQIIYQGWRRYTTQHRGLLTLKFSQVIRNVKKVSHPENTTVHNHLDAKSCKGCIVAGSNPMGGSNLVGWSSGSSLGS